MTQPKPATKPKAQVREVFEILPLEWVVHPEWAGENAEIMFGEEIGVSEACASGNGKCMLYLPRGGDDLHQSEYKSIKAAKAAANRWYRQQLAKALRRVK